MLAIKQSELVDRACNLERHPESNQPDLKLAHRTGGETGSSRSAVHGERVEKNAKSEWHLLAVWNAN